MLGLCFWSSVIFIVFMKRSRLVLSWTLFNSFWVIAHFLTWFLLNFGWLAHRAPTSIFFFDLGGFQYCWFHYFLDECGATFDLHFFMASLYFWPYVKFIKWPSSCMHESVLKRLWTIIILLIPPCSPNKQTDLYVHSRCEIIIDKIQTEQCN